MALRTVTTLNADKVVKLGKDTNSLQGYYLGSKVVKVKSAFSDTATLHFFQTETAVIGTFGAAELNMKLSTVPRGHMTIVTFQGKKTISGGRTQKTYDVQFDDQLAVDTSDISLPNDIPGTGNTSEPDVVDTDDSEDDMEELNSSPSPVVRNTLRPAPRTLSAETIANAQRLLSGRSNSKKST